MLLLSFKIQHSFLSNYLIVVQKDETQKKNHVANNNNTKYKLINCHLKYQYQIPFEMFSTSSSHHKQSWQQPQYRNATQQRYICGGHVQ